MQQAKLGLEPGKTRHDNSRNNAHTYPDISTQFKASQGRSGGGGGGGGLLKAADNAGATQCINYHPTTNHNHWPEVLRAWSCRENNCIQKTKQEEQRRQSGREEEEAEEEKKRKENMKEETQAAGGVSTSLCLCLCLCLSLSLHCSKQLVYCFARMSASDRLT